MFFLRLLQTLAHTRSRQYHKKIMNFQRTWIVGLLVCASMLLSSCMQDYNYPELLEGDIVIALGDQFTAGTGASTAFSYPSVLAKSTNALIINAGRAGRGSSDIMAALSPLLVEHPNVKLVILSIGFNDIQQGTDLRFLRTYISEVILLLEKHKIPMILVGMPKLPYKAGASAHPIYELLASSGERVMYEPRAFTSVLNTQANLETPSQFTATGYRVLAENIEARMKKEGFIR